MTAEGIPVNPYYSNYDEIRGSEYAELASTQGNAS
jgi:hypothetical protein